MVHNSFWIHFSFPKDLTKLTYDEENMRARIKMGILNSHGIRGHFYTPHMTFETFIIEEISRLEDPIRKCVESVVELLSEAVHTCTKRVSYLRILINKLDFI